MPVHTQWHDVDRTIICREITDPWNIDELIDTLDEIRQMLDSVDHTVHFIINVTATTIPGDSLTRLPEITAAAPLGHPCMGINVVVSTNSLVRSLVRIHNVVYKPFYLARTLEEAEQIIEKEKNQPR